MRRWLIAFSLLAASLSSFLSAQSAQQSMPPGIVRGSLVNWEGTISGGSFSVRKADGSVYGCFYDAHTYFSRNDRPVRVTDLTPGEPVEVVSDREPGSRDLSASCYARILQVTYPQPQATRRRPAAETAPPASVPPRRGDLTFAGLVIQCDARTVTLKTRDGESTLLLRPDTSYTGEGVALDAATPLLNKHVFVRGARNPDGQVEAYQVVWGQILPAR